MGQEIANRYAPFASDLLQKSQPASQIQPSQTSARTPELPPRPDWKQYDKPAVFRKPPQTAAPTAPVKTHTGGRVAGQLSQTPGAIRKRQQRALAKQPPVSAPIKPAAPQTPLPVLSVGNQKVRPTDPNYQRYYQMLKSQGKI